VRGRPTGGALSAQLGTVRFRRTGRGPASLAIDAARSQLMDVDGRMRDVDWVIPAGL
jgi:hypothetical protein